MESIVVSILMPVRNAMPYLTECLQSVLDQSYPRWELIAVNDHSTDDSFEILAHHASLDPRIKVYQNKGKGIIPALQLAYKQSQGRLITRMDADDYMSSDKLEQFVSALNQRAGLAVGLVRYFSDRPLGQGYQTYASWLNQLTTDAKNFDEIYKECVIPSANWMLSRKDLDRIGAFSPEIYPEDYDLCFRMYKANLQIIPVRKTTHHWRDHSSRASRNDPNYEDNRFLDIKLHNFLNIEYESNIPLVIWGAGKKGKKIAQMLIDRGIDFRWITNNAKKLNSTIYGVQLEHMDHFFLHYSQKRTHCIITVAGKDDQQEIRKLTEATETFKSFWFC